MNIEQALTLVNEMLSLDMRKTISGKELKGIKPDQDNGGTCKLYLSRNDCKELANAFQILADDLKEMV